MATLQLAMLRNAAALLRSGGAIVYSVCSLMPEEGHGVVAQFIAKIRTTKSMQLLHRMNRSRIFLATMARC